MLTFRPDGACGNYSLYIYKHFVPTGLCDFSNAGGLPFSAP
ncbi:MAG: hypothetical protein V7641_2385 [Blastocatellia bacterium]